MTGKGEMSKAFLSRIQRLALVMFVLVLSVGCDQATKSVVKSTLASSSPVSLLGDSIRFQYSENSGALLNLGSTLTSGTRFALLIVLVSLVLTGITVFIVASRRLALAQVIALSLVVGGGVGNLVDRVANNGNVVDFMWMGVGFLHTAIFNLADVCIVAGIVLLFLSTVRSPHRATDAAGST